MENDAACTCTSNEHAMVNPLCKTRPSKTIPQSIRNAIYNNHYFDMEKELEKSKKLKNVTLSMKICLKFKSVGTTRLVLKSVL